MNFTVVNEFKKTLADCKPGHVFSIIDNTPDTLFLMLDNTGPNIGILVCKYNYIALDGSYMFFCSDEDIPVHIHGKLVRESE